jgi:hypothetical protein
MPELDDRLQVAIRVAAQHRMSAFSTLLDAHREHESFELRDWVVTREMGFVCRCTGEEHETRISIRTLKEILPEARDSFLRFRTHRQRAGSKSKKRAQRKATGKSRALLHRFLTRQQRIELRGLESFRVQGADGLVYLLRSGAVYLLNGEKVIAGFCVVQKGHQYLPVYDLMLAHKLLLETNPKKFWAVANVRDLDPPAPPPPPLDLLPIPPEDLDEPEQWVRDRLQIHIPG